MPLETEEILQEDNRRREGLSQTEDLALYFRERSEEISGIRGSYSKNLQCTGCNFRDLFIQSESITGQDSRWNQYISGASDPSEG